MIFAILFVYYPFIRTVVNSLCAVNDKGEILRFVGLENFSYVFGRSDFKLALQHTLIITVIIALLLPSAAPLVGCLMLGNLMKECGVVDRLSKTVQNELMNIVVIFLGLTVGATATAEAFLNPRTLFILVLGVIAFAMGTAGGVLLAKVMNFFSKGDNKINPLIGSAGVSAVPMAARVSQTEGQKADPSNFLLMHAMGPNVAGVVGSAVAAGILLSFLG